MSKTIKDLSGAIAIGIILLSTNGCGGWWEPSHTATAPAASLIPTEEDATKTAVRFLEEKVRRDKEDFIAHNKLAGYYLQFLRETGNTEYLDLAARAARASLDVVPAEQNASGLAALAQAEFASHDFISARDHAEMLVRLQPSKGYPYLMLGDALIELGDYDRAMSAFLQMEQVAGASVLTEARFGRVALLRGQTELAAKRFSNALKLGLEQHAPQRETVAWCRWQLGEIAFSTGDYESAERHFREALVTFPDYYRAVASLGRALAARGDHAAAIEQYERAVRILPDLSFVAALGDLYKIAGREGEAAAQYALVEQIARLGELNGALYNRQLALFYADHDMKAEAAYTCAKREYETRRDIYGADAVAWTALKSGRIAEAQAAIKEALKLGTRDSRLFYHAGMIARAGGDLNAARDHLKRALALNPQFDPLQARIARRALEE